ncbi:Crp/Fnr family transcriptional regulator [Marinobacter sp. OP 3.4]|uniref:Crp/Fnr family transcriptional regulator n=1 Tax=Marinobacter sp. OP 3.4 TaxID=3076501 RepID=UPI002E22CF87
MTTSCIIRHFQHYAELSPEDQELLNSLEKSPRDYARNTVLWQQGEVTDHFYTVRHGWACTYRNMADGSRQVLDVYVPGDVIGLREFAFRRRVSNLLVITDASLCPFPKSRLAEVFESSKLLCNLFFMISARDQAILVERLINLGRRTAREKVAHFLLEMAHRLDKACIDVHDCNHLPLTQVLLADALGLSSVHINRTLSELKQEQRVSMGPGGVTLLDRDSLVEVAGFDPEYLEEDVDGMLRMLDTADPTQLA